MADGYRITCDLFTLPAEGDNHILYAPRQGFACVANPDLVNLLTDLDRLDVEALNREQRTALDFLDHKGVLNGSQEAPLNTTLPETYAPTQVTLFPTNQCNLRCTYCYASAGDLEPQTLDWHYATRAVEHVIENLKAQRGTHLSLGFHGGGEPLFPWPLIKRIVTYAEERCAEENLELAVFSATNGVLSRQQLAWIVDHFTSLNISFDGLPDVQDAQRPLPGGKGSFPFVDRTMRFLDEHDFSYGLRSTISLLNVHRMEECVDFIGRHYKVKAVHFEPLFYCGRCKTSGTLSPAMQTFAEHFQQSVEKARAYGIKLTYSGAQIENLTSSFCGVSNDNFSVTPDGYITTCFEVTSRDDPRAETFFIGRIDEAGRLDVDEQKRAYLHGLKVHNLDYCNDCFAKWHCAGECATKLGHTDYTGPRGHERCALNRQLVAHRIRQLVEGSPEPAETTTAGELTPNRIC